MFYLVLPNGIAGFLVNQGKPRESVIVEIMCNRCAVENNSIMFTSVELIIIKIIMKREKIDHKATDASLQSLREFALLDVKLLHSHFCFVPRCFGYLVRLGFLGWVFWFLEFWELGHLA